MTKIFNQCILVTGATGFVGHALYTRLSQEGCQIKCALRRLDKRLVNSVIVGDIHADTNWLEAVKSVDTVVHCAAKVHFVRDKTRNPLKEYRRVNVDGTLNLAQAAADGGVKRFIYLSTIKVNGESTVINKPFTANDDPSPSDPYGISKFEAEQGLIRVGKQSGMEVVIIRPPLVYGPGVKANFLQMIRWIKKGIPLPLGAIHNARSLVALDNLVDFILACIEHPAAVNQIFLVSDGEDLSTSDLLRRMARALGVPVRLIPLPGVLLNLGANMVGKQQIYQRLAGSLQVDITKARRLMGWVPLFSVDDGLEKTAQHFLDQHG